METPLKAVSLRSGALTLQDIDDPRPEDGQLLVKVLRCGICGTDLHVRHHCKHWGQLLGAQGYDGLLDDQLPLVMGHEFCAEVLEKDQTHARSPKVGARVVAVPLLRHRGRIEMLGLSTRVTGGFAERMVLQSTLAMEVPNGLSSDHAALTEPMAVGWHAVRRSEIKKSELAVVVGCGPVGLSVISMLRARGVEQIYAVDYSAHRRKLAVQCGASETFDPSVKSPYEGWGSFQFLEKIPAVFELALGSKEMLDKVPLPWWHVWGIGERLGVGRVRPIVFECVGAPGVLQSIIDGVPQFTRIVVVGVCMSADQIEPAVALHKELDIRFALAHTPLEFRQTLHMMADGVVSPDPLITGHVGLEGLPSAFDTLAGAEHHAKILLDPAL